MEQIVGSKQNCDHEANLGSEWTRVNAEEGRLGAWQVFAQDLILASRAWRNAPLLPVSSVIITLGSSALIRTLTAPDSYPLLVAATILMSVALAGWFGTERIWYLRAYRGKGIRPVELWTLTRAFAFRYLGLGLLVFVPILVVLQVVVLWLVRSALVGNQPLPGESTIRTTTIAMFLLNVPVDVFLTFVTPALAYTTRGIRMALGIGWRMLRDEWPRSAGYALVPPLAVLISLQTLPESVLGKIGGLVLSGVGVLLNLWFKGATAAFYLRRYDVNDSGAASSPTGS